VRGISNLVASHVRCHGNGSSFCFLQMQLPHYAEIAKTLRCMFALFVYLFKDFRPCILVENYQHFQGRR
jgi:hypothetical protein